MINPFPLDKNRSDLLKVQSDLISDSQFIFLPQRSTESALRCVHYIRDRSCIQCNHQKSLKTNRSISSIMVEKFKITFGCLFIVNINFH